MAAIASPSKSADRTAQSKAARQQSEHEAGAPQKRAKVEASAVPTHPRPELPRSPRPQRRDTLAADLGHRGTPAVPACPLPARAKAQAPGQEGRLAVPPAPAGSASQEAAVTQKTKPAVLVGPHATANAVAWARATEDVQASIAAQFAFGSKSRAWKQAAEILHAHLEGEDPPAWEPVPQPCLVMKQALEEFMEFFRQTDDEACEATCVTPRQWLEVNHHALLLYHLATSLLQQMEGSSKRDLTPWKEALAAASEATGIVINPRNLKKGQPLCAHTTDLI